MKKIIKLKLILYSILLLFYFLANIQFAHAASCLDKYIDGSCLYGCFEGQKMNNSAGLCGEPLICCYGEGATSAMSNSSFEVELNVPIFTIKKIAGFGMYIKSIYQAALYIIIPLLIVVIIYGGAIWLSSGFDESQKGKAKDHIKQGFIGLGIVLLSYILLSAVGISSLRSLDPEYVAAVEIEEFKLKNLEEANPYTEQVIVDGKNISTKGQQCFYDTFGRTKADVRTTKVPCPGLNKTLTIHVLAADAFRQACAKIPTGLKLTCGKPVQADGDFNWRMVNTGKGPSTTTRSNHSWATAVDISPWVCGVCDNASRSKCSCKPNLPVEVINAFKSTPGFRWGGDYKSKCDFMHFEWLGPCGVYK